LTYHRRLIQIIEENYEAIEAGTMLLASTILTHAKLGQNIFICGNGGSASTSEHFEIDLSFVRNFGLDQKGLPIVSALTANSSVVFAISNDLSFQNVFSSQLARRAREGDLLIAISCSGKSPNLIDAVRFAKRSGIASFGILGFDGGVLKEECDYSVHIKSKNYEYGIVEDVHLSICHASAEIVRSYFST
jgi:D-sedoheptulose 7-phosphate isomerase